MMRRPVVTERLLARVQRASRRHQGLPKPGDAAGRLGHEELGGGARPAAGGRRPLTWRQPAPD